MLVTIHNSKRRLNSHWGPVFDCDSVDIITDETLHESMIVTQTEDYRLEVNYTNRATDGKSSTPWKDAQGDDLPPIDKEVIVIVDYNAQLNIHGEEQPMYRVEFAHRPNKYTKVWNPDLGELQVVEVERFGKGEWNTPNVVWWLDAPMPFKED